PPRPTTTGWPARHEGEVLFHAVRRHGEDGGLVAAAMVVFDIGWTFGLLVGIMDDATVSCRTSFSGFGFGGAPASCNSWPLSLVPLGGGIAAGLSSFGSSRQTTGWGMAFGVPSVI